jgi:hypothetical protein
MFVVPAELAPVIQAACTNDIAVIERRRLVQMLAESGVGDAEAHRLSAWLGGVRVTPRFRTPLERELSA